MRPVKKPSVSMPLVHKKKICFILVKLSVICIHLSISLFSQSNLTVPKDQRQSQ